MALKRFRVPAGALRDGPVSLDAREARHVHVLRLQAGDGVELFDGSGRVAVGTIVDPAADPIVVNVDVVRDADSEPSLRVSLVQAVPVKLPRFDSIVRQATELGVAEIQPVMSARSALPGGGLEVLARRSERWRRIAEAAAKQCGRSRVPDVADPQLLAAVDFGQLPRTRLVLDGKAEEPLASVMREDRPPSCALFVGPEGGWSSDELERLAAVGARHFALGPRTLRADSAGPAALAIVQAAWGDLAG